MNNQNFDSIIRLLAMGNLLGSFASVQAELRYINECKLNKENTGEISDKDALEGLIKELNLKDKEYLKNWQKTNLLSTDKGNLLEYAKYRIFNFSVSNYFKRYFKLLSRTD